MIVKFSSEKSSNLCLKILENKFMQYLQPFFLSLFFSIGIIMLILFWSKKTLRKRKNDTVGGRNEKRHIHKKYVTRLGGVAIILSFIVTVLIDKNLVISNILQGIIWGGVIILIVGVWDDLREIGWQWQLFFQIVAVSVVFLFGAKINYITNPLGGVIYFDTPFKMWVSVLLGVGWSLVLINAINWLDGIDGLSGGVSFIAAMTIFFLSLKPEVNQPPMAIIAMAFAGGLLGFLLFNFYPAKIMAGTGGAFFMGFLLATLAIFAGTKIATTLSVLTIPILDFFWVIIKRIKEKKSVFRADQNHLHHFLLKKGWSQRKIAIFFYLISLLIAVFTLGISTIGKVVLMLFITIVMMVIYGKMLRNDNKQKTIADF